MNGSGYHADMDSCGPRIIKHCLLMLFCVDLLLCLSPVHAGQAMTLSFDGGTVEMPAPAGEPREIRVQLPWGSAVQKSYNASDPVTGIQYHFATFTFPKRAKVIDTTGLLEVREYFPKNRGCTARELTDRDLPDADGRVQPQTVFEGTCEAPVRFQIAVIIAEGRLFWFEVYQNGVRNMNPGKNDLDEVLRRFISGFRRIV